MADPVYKIDWVMDSKEFMPGLHKSIPMLISKTFKRDLQEINIDFDEAELETFVKENCVIHFTYKNVPCTFKIL